MKKSNQDQLIEISTFTFVKLFTSDYFNDKQQMNDRNNFNSWKHSFLCTQKVSTLLKSVSVSGRPSVRPSVYPITRQKSERLTGTFFAQVCLMNISVEFEDENDRLRNAWAIVKILKSNPAIPEGEYRDFFQKKYFLILRLFELSMKLYYRLSMARNPNLVSAFPSEHPIG
jgi:hypothetical protein